MTQPHYIDREAVLRELTSAAARVFNNIHSGRYTRGQVCDWLRDPIDRAQAALDAPSAPMEAVAWRYRHKGPLPGEYDGWVLTTDGGFVRGFLAAQGGYEVQALAVIPTQGGGGLLEMTDDPDAEGEVDSSGMTISRFGHPAHNVGWPPVIHETTWLADGGQFVSLFKRGERVVYDSRIAQPFDLIDAKLAIYRAKRDAYDPLADDTLNRRDAFGLIVEALEVVMTVLRAEMFVPPAEAPSNTG